MTHSEHVRSAPTSFSLRTEERVAYARVKNELKFSIPEMPGCGSTDRELQRGHSPAVVSKKPIRRVTETLGWKIWKVPKPRPRRVLELPPDSQESIPPVSAHVCNVGLMLLLGPFKGPICLWHLPTGASGTEEHPSHHMGKAKVRMAEPWASSRGRRWAAKMAGL